MSWDTQEAYPRGQWLVDFLLRHPVLVVLHRQDFGTTYCGKESGMRSGAGIHTSTFSGFVSRFSSRRDLSPTRTQVVQIERSSYHQIFFAVGGHAVGRSGRRGELQGSSDDLSMTAPPAGYHSVGRATHFVGRMRANRRLR